MKLPEEKEVRTELQLVPGYLGVLAVLTAYHQDGTYNNYKCAGIDEATAWKGMAIELAKLVPRGEA